MAATKEDIHRWLKAGIKQGATHVIIKCDTFDWDDYPSYVMPGEDVAKKVANPGSMQIIMEVYALHLDIEGQLSEHRSWHLESKP